LEDNESGSEVRKNDGVFADGYIFDDLKGLVKFDGG
jgi:hypothetical protein